MQGAGKRGSSESHHCRSLRISGADMATKQSEDVNDPSRPITDLHNTQQFAAFLGF